MSDYGFDLEAMLLVETDLLDGKPVDRDLVAEYQRWLLWLGSHRRRCGGDWQLR